MGRRPDRGQRRVLRPDRPRQGDHPQPDPRQHRDPARRLRPGRSRPTSCSARPSAKILDIAEKGVTGKTTTLQEALNEAYTASTSAWAARTRTRSAASPPASSTSTQHTAGLQNSELIILAARPSVGKTAFALNIVRHVVVEEQLPVFFVSLEQIADRAGRAPALLPGPRGQPQAAQGPPERRRHRQAASRPATCLRNAKLFIDDTPGARHAAHRRQRPPAQAPRTASGSW